LGDVANTDEAAQYRRVMGLLGLGGDLEKTNTGMTAGGYDEAALQAAIDAAVASGQGAEADALRVVGGAPTGDAGTWSKDPLVGPLQDAFNDAGGAISGAFKDALAANNAALKDAVQANKTTGGGAPGGTVHGNAQNSVVQTIEDLVTNPADTLAAGLESTSNVIRDPVGAGKKTLNRWRGR
ncbi:MAG TPA: hypothetical protein VEC14_00795, partial [Reyranellaceae bacterium]|nr:hypothetical protein [Reyranellaceae bacterium]